jgi:hypothetical protein
MSLYREAGRRSAWPLALAAALGIAIGVALGTLIGGSDDGSLSDEVSELRADLRPAAGALELVRIEYSEAVRGGEVVAATEFDASRSHAERARVLVDENSEDLAALSPTGAEEASVAIDRLLRLIDSHAPAARVNAAARQAERALETALGTG